MISPKPTVMALTVSARPTPEASPRYNEAVTSEITGSTLSQMISPMTRTIAMAVCRTSTTVSPPKDFARYRIRSRAADQR